MRWVTYASPAGDDRVGLVAGDVVQGAQPGITMIDLLDSGDLAGAAARVSAAPSETVALVGLRLRAPLQPRSLRDFVGFLQHLRNCSGPANLTVDERHERYPPFYFSNVAAVIGPHDDVGVPPGCERFDYELEVAAVIGKPGSDIAPADAWGHIAGYTLLCDWSGRDLQIDEMALGLGPAKGKDSANTLGPMLVTADELEPHRNRRGISAAMTGYVNGDPVSAGNWDDVDWGFDDMIAYASRGTRLRPGDVIGSGTVPTGCLFEHYALDPDHFRGWLEPGDEVRLAVEHLGEIRHRIVEGRPAPALSSGY
ncbi:MAG: fumarylacetoacetate hydrolase family protein [Pseudonocardia sp.]|nr:fumarylacetoacetate hydrolase family protein [Pseudonocardia sp.]